MERRDGRRPSRNGGEHDDPTGERGGRERTKKMRHVGRYAAEESKGWKKQILDDDRRERTTCGPEARGDTR